MSEQKPKKRPKISYPCGCLVHVNGPDDWLTICRHYCKRHGKVIRAMKEMETK